jgi:dTDP-4-dehydrorhamnose reductase
MGVNEYTDVVILTGAGGYFGQNYRSTFKNSEIITFSSQTACNNKWGIDYLQDESMVIKSKLPQNYKVKYLVHAAAIKPNNAHRYSKETIKNINVDLTKKMIELTLDLKCKLIYISTDMIYKNSNIKTENFDNPKIEDIYTETKFESERLILESMVDNIIVRTSFFGGKSKLKNNYYNDIISKIQNSKKVVASTKNYSNPIGLSNLLKTLQLLKNIDYKGVINIGSYSNTSQYQNVKDLYEKISDKNDFEKLVKDDLYEIDTIMSVSKLEEVLDIKVKTFLQYASIEFNELISTNNLN